MAVVVVCVHALELFDIQVISLTSDGEKPNRHFYRLCKEKLEEV